MLSRRPPATGVALAVCAFVVASFAGCASTSSTSPRLNGSAGASPALLGPSPIGGGTIGGGSVGGGSAAPATAGTSQRGAVAPQAPPSPGGAVGAAVVEPRGTGWTISPTDDGPFALNGTTYRLAWWAPDCSFLAYSLENVEAVSPLENPVRLQVPGGELLIRGLAPGRYYLSHGGACTGPYVMRLESVGS